MTNPIAGDAERLSVQLLKKEKSLIGQASNAKGYRSLGDYVRQLLIQGLEVEDPELAAKYKSVRFHRYVRSIVMCIVVGLTIWQSMTAGFDIRRSKTFKRLGFLARKELVA